MKTIASGLILITSLSLFPGGVAAQEYQGCFMRNANGTIIDLDEICRGEIEPQPTANAEGIIIPIENRLGETPVVNVTFNGENSYEMLFDPEASNTTILPAVAEALNIAPFARSNFNLSDGGTANLGLAVVNSLQAGELIVREFIVAIAPADSNIGVLGQDFVKGYEVEIKENVIELRRR
ncbi:MAG: retropepsin-like aspartic protease [Oscillatoria sp. PMC 1051.18]|nr:retropepsin-like aspartic protease [Oscillatoria sp. PMC 1050.18]MEC5028517.1 retropepsin-like aspartic protease [Oscillatoria sp. PMC 1051.18]